MSDKGFLETVGEFIGEGLYMSHSIARSVGKLQGIKEYLDSIRNYVNTLDRKLPLTPYMKGAIKFVEGLDEMQAAKEVTELDNKVSYHIGEAMKAWHEKQKALPPGKKE